MQLKKIRRLIRDFSARQILRVSVVAIYLVPLPLFRWLGASFGKGFYRFSRRYRELAANNLNIAFGDQGEDYLRTIGKESFISMGTNGADSLWFVNRSHRKRRNLVRLVDQVNLDKSLEAGKGVIVVTAHVGIFTILGGVLASYGYCTNYILRTPRDEKMAAVLGRALRMQGVRPIFTQPAIKCVEASISALRRNEILIILIDQDIGDSGIFVKFFGRAASTPAGPVIFSLRTGAKIIPAFMIRDNGRHKLWIHPEFKLIDIESAERTIFKNTQRLTHLVEDVIRGYPQQWSWIDRRWKTKPITDVHG